MVTDATQKVTDATYVNILTFIRNMPLALEPIPTLIVFGTSVWCLQINFEV